MAAGNVPPSTTVNVQTLSNAIAVFTQALQSASVAPNTNQANPSSTGANQAGPHLSHPEVLPTGKRQMVWHIVGK